MSEVKEKWGFRTHPVRTALLVILALIGGLIFGAAVDAVWVKADAVECAAFGPTGECETVTDSNRNVAEKVRTGEIPQARDAFDMRNAFSEPKKVREVIEGRIKAGMIAMQGTPAGEKMACCTDGAVAAAYLTLVDGPVCGMTHESGVFNIKELYGNSTMCRASNMPDSDQPNEYITADEAKKVATVFFCGTSMALAIAFSGASAGATAAIGLSAAGGCLMSVWD